MTQIFAAVLILMTTSTVAHSQCDQPVKLTGSTTEYLSADSTVERSINENSVVRFDKKSITVSSDNDKTMKGVIHSSTCDWTDPFKEVKTLIQTTFTYCNDINDVTITILGKAGKVTLFWYMKSKDRIIRVAANTFEEDKISTR